MSNPYEKGNQMFKPALWGYYSIVNFFGAILCLYAFFCIIRKWKYREKYRTGFHGQDVFIGSLMLACASMSLWCSAQCFYDLVMNNGQLEGEYPACFTEATMHITNILNQFFSIVFITMHVWLQLVLKCTISICASVIITVLFWCFTLASTFIISIFFAAPELQPAGLYCFPRFDSPIMIYFFVPLATLALLSIVFFNGHLYWFLYTHERKIAPWLVVTSTPRRNSQVVARKTVLFFIVALLGWIFAVVSIIYALTHQGKITETLETLVGVFGTLHTPAQAMLWLTIFHRGDKLTSKVSSTEKTKTISPKKQLLSPTASIPISISPKLSPTASVPALKCPSPRTSVAITVQ